MVNAHYSEIRSLIALLASKRNIVYTQRAQEDASPIQAPNDRQGSRANQTGGARSSKQIQPRYSKGDHQGIRHLLDILGSPAEIYPGCIPKTQPMDSQKLENVPHRNIYCELESATWKSTNGYYVTRIWSAPNLRVTWYNLTKSRLKRFESKAADPYH